jgi:predicted nucleic acid-binding protein
VLVVDAGPLYAAAARRDRDHARCAALLRAHAGAPLVVPALVVTEVAYLIGDRLGGAAEAAFARALRDGELLVEPPTQDWARITQLCETYADLPLGIVDASVIAAAERLGADSIATLDHRHFAVVRPVHLGAFTLLPD